MAYEPLTADTAVPALDTSAPSIERSRATATAARTLHVGALSMDARTGQVRWRGETLHLSAEERELLAEMLRHGGQIMSADRLATRLHARRDAIEARMHTLVRRLQEEGVRLVPRHVEGCGYVLWR